MSGYWYDDPDTGDTTWVDTTATQTPAQIAAAAYKDSQLQLQQSIAAQQAADTAAAQAALPVNMGQTAGDLQAAQDAATAAKQVTANGALTQAINTASAPPIPVTPPAGALTQTSVPTPPVTVPDWFKYTPQYAALSTTVGATPDTTNYEGDITPGNPGVTTGPTAQQTADAYSKFAATNTGYNQYADPGMQNLAPAYTNYNGDQIQAEPGYITYSMLPQNLQHMPGSTGSNMWGLGFDPGRNIFTQKLPGSTDPGINQYQNYDTTGKAIGDPYTVGYHESGWVDFRNWAEIAVPIIVSAGAMGAAAAATEAAAGAGAGTVAAADAASTASTLSNINTGIQATSAANQALQGNYTGAIIGGLGAAAGATGTNVPSTGTSGMDLAADASSGANSLGSAANALDTGASLTSTLASNGITLKNAATAAKIASAVSSGDYANAAILAANSSGQLPSSIDGVSTADLSKLATAALAISSGNPSAIINAAINSGKTWNAANNVWNAATSSDAAPVSDTQAAIDALSLADGPNQNPSAYALPEGGTIPTSDNSAAEQAANAAADALLNQGALTQVVNAPVTVTTPAMDQQAAADQAAQDLITGGLDNTVIPNAPADGALTQVIQDNIDRVIENPNATPLDRVTVSASDIQDNIDQYTQDLITGGLDNTVIPNAPNTLPTVTVVGHPEYPSADQAVQDALNLYSPAAPSDATLPTVTVVGHPEYPSADQAVQDALNLYSPAAPSDATLPTVTIVGHQDPLSDLVPTEVNAPPAVVPVVVPETPPPETTTAPTVPTIPTIPTIPEVPPPVKKVPPPKTVAPLPQQKANHLPGVDLSFLNPGPIIDENKLMPMAQALVDQSNGTLTLPEALTMVKQNQPKGKK